MKQFLKRKTFVAAAAMFFPAITIAVFFSFRPPAVEKKTVIIKDVILSVEVAADQLSRAKGLSGRGGLKKGEGMLFLFPIPDRYGFWMKEMKFPIDIIWIRDGEVVGVTAEVQPPTDNRSPLPVFYPPQAVDAVLEVKAGWAKKHAIAFDDTVEIK